MPYAGSGKCSSRSCVPAAANPATFGRRWQCSPRPVTATWDEIQSLLQALKDIHAITNWLAMGRIARKPLQCRVPFENWRHSSSGVQTNVPSSAAIFEYCMGTMPLQHRHDTTLTRFFPM